MGILSAFKVNKNYSSTPARGWSNVVNVFKAPFQKNTAIAIGRNNPKVIPAVSSALKVTTAAAEIGSIAYGGALAVKSLPAIGGGAAAARVTSTAAKTAGGSSALTKLVAATGLGLGAGALIAGSGGNKSKQDADTNQYTNPTQETTTSTDPTQEGDNPYFPFKGDYNTISYVTRKQQDTYSQTYNYPTQSTTPTQTATQTAEQTKGTDWIIPAAIVAGAIILTRK